ncbi:MAG: Uma2 family endonuclease [Candidatus Melainabacteria bacterium]|nr:Uma2 family endonuclease [Candidatus Melainabacteria bacterium]
MAKNELANIPPDKYLESEAKASVRHEYVDGTVFVMADETRRHNIIGVNIVTIVRSHLRGSPCQAYMEGVKVRIKAANCFYYPDVMVACDQGDPESVYVDEPVLIVEVLSRSTGSTDRREKLVNYMTIPTLIEYVIVHQRVKRVDVYRRNKNDNFDESILSTADDLVLESLPNGKLMIPIEAIYENIRGIRDGSLEVREELIEYGDWFEDDEVDVLD